MNRRPKLTLLGHTATPEEAAAVVAAIEQFMRETAPPLAPAAEREPGWVAAARLEAVGRESDAAYPWS
jgi:hypothetical protein